MKRLTDAIERIVCSRRLERAIWVFLCLSAGYFGGIAFFNIINR